GLHALGADDQHRDVLGLGVAAQCARGLESVHARQHDIHQHQVRLLAPAQLDAVLGVARRQHLVAVPFKQLGQHRGVGRRVLDDQDAGHGGSPFHALTWVRIASRSSSRVNGLVTYCSEPTMRPRALSNRPSLDDSMITGVLLNIWLFLISAQVWYPSRRGIMMSTKMICGFWSAILASASKPSTAVTTSAPSRLSRVSAVRRMVFESSITITRRPSRLAVRLSSWVILRFPRHAMRGRCPHYRDRRIFQPRAGLSSVHEEVCASRGRYGRK